jgi:hypothetical protein
MTGEENVLRTPIITAFFAVLSLTACASAPPKQQGDDNAFTQPTKPDSSESSGESTGEAPAEGGGLNEEQKQQMEIALRRGGDKAAQCPTSTGVEDVPRGKGEVKVVFDGQKGRVTEVTVGPPWAGGAIESCIKRSFIGEIVLPFEGEPLEVPYTIELPAVRTGTAPGTKKK